jgi:hypothetical protein
MMTRPPGIPAGTFFAGEFRGFFFAFGAIIKINRACAGQRI